MAADSLVAFALWLGAWVGFTVLADRTWSGRGLMSAAGRHRLRWMQEMIGRDQRIVDSQIAMTLSRHVLFFAQTSIFLIAGLLAALGAVPQLGTLLAEIPFARRLDPAHAQLKLLLLVGVFVYGFFKFTWSLRLFNYLMVMIGGAPAPGQGGCDEYARRAARVGDLAVDHFNRGLRGYYFGLALLPWFVHPWLFVAATLVVVAVAWRREFRSRTLAAMKE